MSRVTLQEFRENLEGQFTEILEESPSDKAAVDLSREVLNSTLKTLEENGVTSLSEVYSVELQEGLAGLGGRVAGILTFDRIEHQGGVQ